MADHTPPLLLTPDTIQMLVASVTQNSNSRFSELETERLLNAVARAQSGVPTGIRKDM